VPSVCDAVTLDGKLQPVSGQKVTVGHHGQADGLPVTGLQGDKV